MRYQLEVEFHKDYVGVEGDKIFISLNSRPERGEANMELTKKLAKYFGVSSSQVKIVSGWKSRTKIVEIGGVEKRFRREYTSLELHRVYLF